MNAKVKERLAELQARFHRDDHVLVLINADPDSIASAMAFKRLLWRRAGHVVIAAINVMERPDNLAMVTYIKADIKPWNPALTEGVDRFVLVDSQPHHSPVFEALFFDVVIDHHPDGGRRDGFTDIRPEYGATATMMTEYLRGARIKPSVRLSTALLYAIKTDTNNFRRKTQVEDVRAFQYLYRHCNVHMLQRVEQAELKPSFLRFFQKALKNRIIKRNRLYAHLGTVPTPDILVIIADFYMKVDGITWSIVSGVYGKKLVVIFRNDGVRKNAGRLAEQSFGAFGSAGGHKDMARAEMVVVECGMGTALLDEAKMQRWIIGQIEKRR